MIWIYFFGSRQFINSIFVFNPLTNHRDQIPPNWRKTEVYASLQHELNTADVTCISLKYRICSNRFLKNYNANIYLLRHDILLCSVVGVLLTCKLAGILDADPASRITPARLELREYIVDKCTLYSESNLTKRV